MILHLVILSLFFFKLCLFCLLLNFFTPQDAIPAPTYEGNDPFKSTRHTFPIQNPFRSRSSPHNSIGPSASVSTSIRESFSVSPSPTEVLSLEARCRTLGLDTKQVSLEELTLKGQSEPKKNNDTLELVPFYVINLARRTDRRSTILNTLQFEQSVTIVSAVDSCNCSQVEAINNFRQNRTSIPNNSKASVILSWVRAMQLAHSIGSSSGHAIILEDDLSYDYFHPSLVRFPSRSLMTDHDLGSGNQTDDDSKRSSRRPPLNGKISESFFTYELFPILSKLDWHITNLGHCGDLNKRYEQPHAVQMFAVKGDDDVIDNPKYRVINTAYWCSHAKLVNLARVPEIVRVLMDSSLTMNYCCHDEILLEESQRNNLKVWTVDPPIFVQTWQLYSKTGPEALAKRQDLDKSVWQTDNPKCKDLVGSSMCVSRNCVEVVE
eukprot:c7202_g1_i1.p1 GENE.c7202_g1_i1~~c7202_g1_i1.p1  ORF type:complete len:435 (-),score=75.34 c7202_g1_i1:101-1405(-)